MTLPPINLWTLRAVTPAAMWLGLAELATLHAAPPARHGCWRDRPLPHPWHADIPDTACGYDDRLTAPKCAGCWRQRPESPLDQIPDAHGVRPGR